MTPSYNPPDSSIRIKLIMTLYFLCDVYGYLSSELFGQYDISGSCKGRNPSIESTAEIVNLRLIPAYRWCSNKHLLNEWFKKQRGNYCKNKGGNRESDRGMGSEFYSFPGPQLHGSILLARSSGTGPQR